MLIRLVLLRPKQQIIVIIKLEILIIEWQMSLENLRKVIERECVIHNRILEIFV